MQLKTPTGVVAKAKGGFSLFSVFGQKNNQVVPINTNLAVPSANSANNSLRVIHEVTEKVLTPQYIQELALDNSAIIEEEMKLHSQRFRSQAIEESKREREP